MIAAPIDVRTLDAFYNVEAAVAQNWLSWCAHTFSEDYLQRVPVLLNQREQARELIAEKCAGWFEVQS